MNIRPGQNPGYPLGDRLLSMSEASALVGLSPDTLRRCNARKELTIVKLSPRRIGVWLSDLMRFISERAA